MPFRKWFVLFLLLASSASADCILKQSTAVDIGVGPFLDETTGKDAETALTITQPDIRLKKNGGAWAQKNAAQTLSHEEAGWYEVSLDTTDTGTLGLLTIAIHESGALPVWLQCEVVTANVYDTLFSTDIFDTSVTQWNGTAVATPATAGYVYATIKDGTGTGEIDTASGAVATVNALGTGAIAAASFAAGAIDATAIAADAIGASELAASAIGASEIATDAIDDDALASDTNGYQAKVWMVDDDAGAADRYTVIWYLNSQPVVAGITSPAIQVIKIADGTDLVASTAMTEIGSTGTYRYVESSNRIVSGAGYIIKVSATIGGSSRTWYQPMSRD